MTWKEMASYSLIQDKEVSEPGRPYGVSAVMIPARYSELTFNGKKAKGQIWLIDLNGYPFSAGTLAFSEMKAGEPKNTEDEILIYN